MWLEPSDVIRRELRRGETLIWAGQPRQGMYLQATDAFLIPFSLMWGGFAIFWEVIVLSTGAPLLMSLCGVPFVLFGIYLIIGRFFTDAIIRRKTFYGVTNERIIVVGGYFSSTVHSQQIRNLPQVQFREYADGTGTIDVSLPNQHDDWNQNQNPWQAWSPTRLERVKDARRVYDQILELQREPVRHRSSEVE